MVMSGLNAILNEAQRFKMVMSGLNAILNGAQRFKMIINEFFLAYFVIPKLIPVKLIW